MDTSKNRASGLPQACPKKLSMHAQVAATCHLQCNNGQILLFRSLGPINLSCNQGKAQKPLSLPSNGWPGVSLWSENQLIKYFFFFYLFFGIFVFFLPLPPLRGQPAVSCQPCWLPNKEWHVPAGWRDAGFEPGTAGFTVWCTTIEPPHPVKPPNPLKFWNSPVCGLSWFGRVIARLATNRDGQFCKSKILAIYVEICSNFPKFQKSL